MSDEFDAYDLSEFTEQDFIDIDNLVRARAAPSVQIAIERSPFDKFLSWKNHLAVTDLVSPLWCEVQYEYSLYGRRNKPLHLRPPTFTSKTGKRIRVDQQVARANDRRLKRGKSVHKALENELRPDELIINVVSEEERFGLRFLRLVDGLNQLVSDGITRELPVFAITHAHVVLGIIDEVLHVPLIPQSQDQVVSQRSPSNTSVLPPNKKQRLISSKLPTASRETEPTNTGDLYELRIVDYKTRRSSNIPLDEDSLSPRLQLMMYHRMLSSLLDPEAFDFDLLWRRLNLNPTKPFSAQFLKDILWEQRKLDSSDCDVNLNCLVSLWCSTVQRKCTGLIGVSQQLQIVYRRSVYAGKQREEAKHKATETMDMDDPLEALTFQEELDLARAIEESLSELGHREARQVAHLVAHNIKQVGSTCVGRASAVWKDLVSPLDSEQGDPALAWAIQQSLLSCAHKAQIPANISPDATHGGTLDETRHVVGASEEQVREVTTAKISPIIGMKEVKMNEDELDGHLADVLQWWFGRRPARGVDVGQTNRCFTCEYQDSCEWREQKAREAAALVSARKVQDRSRDSVW